LELQFEKQRLSTEFLVGRTVDEGALLETSSRESNRRNKLLKVRTAFSDSDLSVG
jgi:hypothetical protein